MDEGWSLASRLAKSIVDYSEAITDNELNTVIAPLINAFSVHINKHNGIKIRNMRKSKYAYTPSLVALASVSNAKAFALLDEINDNIDYDISKVIELLSLYTLGKLDLTLISSTTGNSVITLKRLKNLNIRKATKTIKQGILQPIVEGIRVAILKGDKIIYKADDVLGIEDFTVQLMLKDLKKGYVYDAIYTPSGKFYIYDMFEATSYLKGTVKEIALSRYKRMLDHIVLQVCSLNVGVSGINVDTSDIDSVKKAVEALDGFGTKKALFKPLDGTTECYSIQKCLFKAKAHTEDSLMIKVNGQNRNLDVPKHGISKKARVFILGFNKHGKAITKPMIVEDKAK